MGYTAESTSQLEITYAEEENNNKNNFDSFYNNNNNNNNNRGSMSLLGISLSPASVPPAREQKR